MSCESGAETFFCDGTVTGGVPPYSLTWKAIQNAYFVGDVHSSFVHGTCAVGEGVIVKLVAIDSVGIKKNNEGTTPCLEVWPYPPPDRLQDTVLCAHKDRGPYSPRSLCERLEQRRCGWWAILDSNQ